MTVCTKRAEELSYLSYLVYVKQGHGYAVLSDIRGGAQEKKCVGGLMQVCEKLASEIGTQNVLLRAPVKTVEQDARGCTVTTANGARHRCRRVICTAPPACLEDIKVSYGLRLLTKHVFFSLFLTLPIRSSSPICRRP